MTRWLMATILVVAGALALPAAAAAGGFATVGLSSTPDGTRPGEPWDVRLTVLQHGRTPLEGVRPQVRIAADAGTRAFVARPTGEPGVYRARVVFPAAGRWRLSVDDDFSATHAFPPVNVGAAAPTPVADEPPWAAALGAALLAGLLAGGATALARRRLAASPAA